LSGFVPFIKELAVTVGADMAENAIYHAVNTAVHVGMFASRDGHDLMRMVNFARTGRATLETMIDKVLMTVIPRDQGEFMMHLKTASAGAGTAFGAERNRALSRSSVYERAPRFLIAAANGRAASS
jgi:hypothetical protein